ncbi:MAG: alkaline phosphatase family protein [Planctomycetota bacterium]|nr:alkaline phosphatase family protein [Planctomycetota bacterium]
MKPVLLLNVAGLTRRQIDESTPNLRSLATRGDCAPMRTVLPAVTCSAQATMLTGLMPSEHGCVGNGWFFRDLGEVWFWRQSNALVRGEKLYEAARELEPGFTCAKLFWWWNMGAAVDWSITPRPFYPADGRKLLAVYGQPDEFRAGMERDLGKFPFFDFWGPKAGLGSSRWIADATMRTMRTYRPMLTMAYLPHLDYDQQRHGPRSQQGKRALVEIDAIVGELVACADEVGAETVVVSEYGLEEAATPVHVNRALREHNLLQVRETPTGEILDVFASHAFAVSDHQVAHVYAKDRRSCIQARSVLVELPGVADVLEEQGKREHGLDHPNAGDLVVVADKGHWFTYYYWRDDRNAPDFAPTVDIHRKPGYDPCEMLVDPELKIPALRVARRLLQKAIGMRYLMDVIPLDATLVKGSHGRPFEDAEDGAVFLASAPFARCGGEPEDGTVAMTSVKERVLALLQRD